MKKINIYNQFTLTNSLFLLLMSFFGSGMSFSILILTTSTRSLIFSLIGLLLMLSFSLVITKIYLVLLSRKLKKNIN